MTLYILGNGGHARVCFEAIERIWPNAIFLDKNDKFPIDNAWVNVVNGIGDIKIRKRVFKQYKKHKFIPVIHKSAVVAKGILGEGVQIMAGAVVQTGTVFGDNVLINTRASIDHDCIIGSHCHVAPGAILCGGVKLGHSCFIGAGAIIVEGVELEPETFVPAGTLVVGPSDFRKPLPLVRDHGTDKIKISEDVGGGISAGRAFDISGNPNP